MAGSTLDSGWWREASAADVAVALRAHAPVPDEAFDQFLPGDLRAASRTYWTPLEVARRVATWIEELRITSVVDIGSGAGKFCIAAALRSRATFRGVEHRANLVTTARELALRFELASRVTFELGSLTEIPVAEAYYLYNPFSENRYRPAMRLDDRVALSGGRFVADVITAETLLSDAAERTYVITYNGFGGQVPGTYRRMRSDDDLPGILELWQKTATS